MQDFNTLFLSGGGVRGVAYLGIMRKLEELAAENIHATPRHVISVSVGSIFGLMIALGFTYHEAYDIVMKKNFQSLTDTRIRHMITDYGLDSGDNIVAWVGSLMSLRGLEKTATFADLYDYSGMQYEVLSYNLTNRCLERFDYINTPDYPIVQAIRHAISIPLIFAKSIGQNNSIYIDAAVVSNIPVSDYQDAFGLDIDKTLIIWLKNKTSKQAPLDSLQHYIKAIIGVMRSAADTPIDRWHTMPVDVAMENLVDFNIKRDIKKTLVEEGYAAADAYFKKTQ
jgi:predicted acylesterase/phospholipase RssA